MGRAPTYWDYIGVEQLLSLQTGLADDDAKLANDEVLFITVHQIDELWFKLLLRELVAIRDLFKKDPVPEQALSDAVRGLRRASLLLRNVAHHFELMETLTTRDYLAFRDKLSPASGFQSAQLREIEIMLGLEASMRIKLGHEDSYLQALRYPDGSPSPASKRVEARLGDRPSIKEAVHAWLFRTPIRGSTPENTNDEAVVRAFIGAYLEAHARELQHTQHIAVEQALTDPDRDRLRRRYADEAASARAFLEAEAIEPATKWQTQRIRAALVFIESYRELPLLAWPREVVDNIVALEQALLIFRQRHARMVERVIGRRTGTGGSAGVDYLDQTALRYRVFGDVWAVRTLLLRRSALPPLQETQYYDFAGGH